MTDAAPTPAGDASRAPESDPNLDDAPAADSSELSATDESSQASAPPADAPMHCPSNCCGSSEALPRDAQPGKVIVRYGLMQQLGEFTHSLEQAPRVGTKVVIRTERGVEIGQVLSQIDGRGNCCISRQRLAEFIKAAGPEYSFRRDGKILRLANAQDLIDQRHLDSSSHEERSFCRQQIRELRLAMRLVTVEHVLGGERIIFYFTSEARIDFRELVRRLASQYRTRIEMRQVGARDEARLVGDYERCGQQCCCQMYLKELKPVSMRMAKVQKATLDPSKISGRCGRLMCCLRYEDATYEELRKKLPRKNSWVRTATLVGRVLEGQIITQLVRLALPDGTLAVVANEEIIERDVPAPEIPAARAPRETKARDRSQMKPLRDQASAPAAQLAGPQADEAELDIPLEAEDQPLGPEDADAQGLAQGAAPGAPGQPREGSSKRRRRRRKNKSASAAGSGQNPPAGPAIPVSPGASTQPAGPQNQPREPDPNGSSSKKRRRRRRGGSRPQGPQPGNTGT